MTHRGAPESAPASAPEFGAAGRDREVGEQYGDVLGHQRPGEQVRLDAIARTFDAQTRQRLEAVGVAADWSCLEVGAGTGTIAHWLAGQCPRGRVTATDLDVTLIREPVPGNLTVLVHDIAKDAFSEGAFDLIHARAVLMHLPQREQIVARMLEWLVPGGVLVLEELVHFPRHGLPAASPLRRVIDAWWDLLSASFGMDDAWGGRAPQVLRDAGYKDVQVAADLPAFHAGSPIAEFSRLTVLSVAPRLIAAGMLSEADVRAGLEEIDDPEHLSFPIAVIATSGRRPGS